MTEVQADPWREFISSGRTLRFDVDRTQLTATLGRNNRYLLVMGVISALVVVVMAVLAATGIGRVLTYTLLAVLLVVMLANVGIGLIARRRVLKALAVEGVFIEVDSAGVRLAGVPALAWPQLLGVVVSDNRGTLEQGGRFGRWVRGVMYRTGGALHSVILGVGDMRAVRAAAEGPRVASLDLAVDEHGAAVVHLDVALAPAECDQVREALRAAATLHDTPFLFTADNGAVARATLQMGRGERMATA